MVGSLALTFEWGYHVGFFRGSSSDDKLVPSAEMVGSFALTVGWGYHVDFFGGSNSDDKVEVLFVSFRYPFEF